MKIAKHPTSGLTRTTNGRVLRLDQPAAEEAAQEAEPKAVGSARMRAMQRAESQRHRLSPRDEESALEIAAFVGRMLAARRAQRPLDDV